MTGQLSRRRVIKGAKRIYRLSRQDDIRFDGKSVKKAGYHTWSEALKLAWREEKLLKAG